MPDENENVKAAAEEESSFENGSITVKKDGHYIHCLTVIGQIEGHYILPSQNKTTKYEHVIPQLVAIEESREIEGLLIILNTVGGDVEAGLAIAELIATMKAPTASLVLGGGHSIGVYRPQVGNQYLIKDDRVDFLVPADYSAGSEIEQIMKTIILKLNAESQLERITKQHAQRILVQEQKTEELL